MDIFATDSFTFELPRGHRFPLEKYRLLRERVEQKYVPPAKLLRPEAATDDELLLAHSGEYLSKLKNGTLTEKDIRRLGLPWSQELLERSRRSVGGTIEACRSALRDGIAVSLSGGTHHACLDHGQGFCVFNDVAVALRVLQQSDKIRRAVVLDCDVHQGNGTAEILANFKSLFTFSMHGQNNFPFRKIPGDMDVPLPDGTGDQEYLEVLEEGVQRAIALSTPDLIVYLAGADPYHDDRLGRLSLSKSGLLTRDQFVLNLAKESHLPICIVMSGGYGRDITDTVDIHLATVGLTISHWLNRN